MDKDSYISKEITCPWVYYNDNPEEFNLNVIDLNKYKKAIGEIYEER